MIWNDTVKLLKKKKEIPDEKRRVVDDTIKWIEDRNYHDTTLEEIDERKKLLIEAIEEVG